MKKFITILAMMLICLVCKAASPQLACESIIERKDLRTKGHEIVKITHTNNYFRSIEAESDPKLLKEVKNAVEMDKKLASNLVEGFDGDEEYVFLNIPRGNYIINVGFHWCEENGYVKLYIQSSPEAFK